MNCKKKKKSVSQYQKLRFFFLKMDNLHFLPNNILTRFFKESTKYKNDYISIVFKLYIYIYELYYAPQCVFFKYIHAYAWDYRLEP